MDQTLDCTQCSNPSVLHGHNHETIACSSKRLEQMRRRGYYELEANKAYCHEKHWLPRYISSPARRDSLLGFLMSQRLVLTGIVTRRPSLILCMLFSQLLILQRGFVLGHSGSMNAVKFSLSLFTPEHQKITWGVATTPLTLNSADPSRQMIQTDENQHKSHSPVGLTKA